MRRRIVILLASVALVVSCGCSVNEHFVTAVDDAWQVLGPEYVEYVRTDPDLDADSKRIRIRTAKILSETIAEAKP